MWYDTVIGHVIGARTSVVCIVSDRLLLLCSWFWYISMLDPVPLDTLKPILMRGYGLKTITEPWQGHGLKTMTESPSPPVGVKAHHPQRSLASVKGSEAVSECGRLGALNCRSLSRPVLISMGVGALPRGRHGLTGCESLVSQPQLPGPAYKGSWSYPYQRGLENPSAVRNTRILGQHRRHVSSSVSGHLASGEDVHWTASPTLHV